MFVGVGDDTRVHGDAVFVGVGDDTRVHGDAVCRSGG